MTGDERAARRTLLLAGVALVVLAVAVVVVALRDDGSAVVADGDRAVEPFAPQRLGPAEGLPVATYAERAAARRASIEGQVIGIVSFAEYRTTADLGALTEGIDVEAVLVCLVADLPATVRGDVRRWEEERRAEAAADLAEIESLLPTVDDVDFAAFYGAERRRLERLVGSTTDTVVYGFVGRGEASVFRGRNANPAVRLVDLYDPTSLDGVALRGLRPEEVGTTGQPPHRP